MNKVLPRKINYSASIFLFLFIFLFSFNFVSSLDTLKPAELNKEYTILQTCSDATYINISVSNSQGLLISDGEMIKNGSVWTYDITPSVIGRHDVGYESDGCEKSGASYFEVTPDGFVGTLGFFILILVLSLGVIILGFSISDAPVTILGSLGLYFLGIYILFNGIDGFRDPTYTWAFGLITLGIAMYISIRSAFELIVD